MARINAFSGNVTPLVSKFSLHMVEYKCLRENSTTILERERERERKRERKPQRVYKKMEERILEANLEGQGW